MMKHRLLVIAEVATIVGVFVAIYALAALWHGVTG